MGLIYFRLCFAVSDQTLHYSLYLQNTNQIRIRLLSKVCIKFVSVGSLFYRGFRLTLHSHSIVADLQTLIDKGLQARK